MIALITGASGGIGYQIAREFAERKFDIILVALDKEILEEKAKELEENFGIKTYVICQDLSLPNASETLYNQVKQLSLNVDALVNNAGFGTFGKFSDVDFSRQKALLSVNVTALMELSYLFIKDMKDRKSGYVLNVASIASFLAGPYMAMYYASKAFVLSFTESLHNEYINDNIKVSALCPGPTATDFEKNAQMKDSNMFVKLKVSKPEVVAKKGVKALFRNKTFYICGASNKFLITLSKFMPRKLTRNFSQNINLGKNNKNWHF